MSHKPLNQFLEKIKRDKKKVIVRGYYAHYKHPGVKAYQVVDVGILEATEEAAVIYKSLETGIVWIRTVEVFLEKVEYMGKKVKRFELIGV